MATVYPAARNLCAAATDTKWRNTSNIQQPDDTGGPAGGPLMRGGPANGTECMEAPLCGPACGSQ